MVSASCKYFCISAPDAMIRQDRVDMNVICENLVMTIPHSKNKLQIVDLKDCVNGKFGEVVKEVSDRILKNAKEDDISFESISKTFTHLQSSFIDSVNILRDKQGLSRT